MRKYAEQEGAPKSVFSLSTRLSANKTVSEVVRKALKDKIFRAASGEGRAITPLQMLNPKL